MSGKKTAVFGIYPSYANVESGVDGLRAAGFNNQDICLMPTPLLTSVDQQVQLTVDAAVDQLLGQIGRPPHPHPQVQMISPKLVVRDSTGPAAKGKA